MRPWIYNRHPNDVIRAGVKNGVNGQLLKGYRNGKARFKDSYFTNRGGLDNVVSLREQPPRGMDPRDWNKHVDFYVSESGLRRSEISRTGLSKKTLRPRVVGHLLRSAKMT